MACLPTMTMLLVAIVAILVMEPLLTESTPNLNRLDSTRSSRIYNRSRNESPTKHVHLGNIINGRVSKRSTVYAHPGTVSKDGRVIRRNRSNRGKNAQPGLVRNRSRPGKNEEPHFGVRHNRTNDRDRKGSAGRVSARRNRRGVIYHGGPNRTRGAHQAGGIPPSGGDKGGGETGGKAPGGGDKGGGDTGGKAPGGGDKGGDQAGGKAPGGGDKGGDQAGGKAPGGGDKGGGQAGGIPPSGGDKGGGETGGKAPGGGDKGGSETGGIAPGGGDKGERGPGDNNQGSNNQSGSNNQGGSNNQTSNNQGGNNDQGSNNQSGNNQGSSNNQTSNNQGGNNNQASGSGQVGQGGGNSSAGNATKPDCKKEGGVCGDPQVVGGDGRIYYFYGRRDHDFCLVSDPDLHINAHFIGTRPRHRVHDSTWVQSLAFFHARSTLTIATDRHISHWSPEQNHLRFTYNNRPLNLTTSTWTSPDRSITLTGYSPNSVEMAIKGKMKVAIIAVPVTRKSNLLHKYEVPEDVDCFAHLDMQFTFWNLSPEVDGVLGQTYWRVNRTVVEDAFESSSLLATDCASSRFTGGVTPATYVTSAKLRAVCRSNGFPGHGIRCHA